MADKRRTGFIGLGLMGSGMAANIAKKHGQVNVYDVDPAAVKRLVAAGATAKATPREVATVSDVVLMSLPHPDITRKVVLGPDGVAEGMAPGGIVVGLSTDGRDAVHEVAAALKAKGVRFVDCPVGKGP